MREIRAILEGWRKAGDQPMVLVTVVETRGSTYRKTGARMLITQEGWIAGSISGGCLEGDLMQTAWDRTANGTALVTFDASSDQDIVWGFGLGCNGVVRVVLERLSPDDESLTLLEKCVRENSLCHVATVVAEGPALGNRRVVAGDESAGAEIVLPDELPANGYETRAQVLIEAIEPPIHLMVFGAGHDALPLVQFGSALGWRTTVIDHRPTYATAERFPSVDTIIVTPPQQISGRVELDERTYAVVMTHNYLSDLAILELLLTSPVAYIGLLGPAARRERLLGEAGHSEATRVHGPVGLDIGADGPEEIALAIVAQIQAVRTGRTGVFLDGASAGEVEACVRLA